MAGKELKGREKVVSKMTRDGLTEENLADGSVKDISHKSRGRPPEMKQDFVFDREKKKAQQSDGQGEERNLQKKQIRKSSLRKEAISEEPILEESVLDGEGTGEKNVFGESPKYKKKFREHAQIPEDDSLTGQKKKIRKKPKKNGPSAWPSSNWAPMTAAFTMPASSSTALFTFATTFSLTPPGYDTNSSSP